MTIVRRSSFVIALLAGLSVLAACDKDKDAAKADPTAATATAAATTAAATGTAAPTGAATGEKKDDEPPVGAGTPAEKAAGGGSTTVTDGTKVVNLTQDGGTSALNLKNERGQGSVTTDPTGGTTIKGKSGKSLTIPPIPTK